MTDASTKGLKPRSLEIFHEVVAAYLEDGLPVGSSRLAKSSKLDLSPASIRGKMSDLEDAGCYFAAYICRPGANEPIAPICRWPYGI